MYKLRDYQQESVDIGVDYLLGKSRTGALLVESTGSGKSLIIGGIAKKLKKPLLVIQPSRELTLQNHEKAVSLGMMPTIYSASCKSKELSELTYATLKSVKKVADDLKSYGVNHVIIDEADMNIPASNDSEWALFQEEMGIKKVLGLTASPVKLQQYTPMAADNYSQLNMLNRIKDKTFSKILYVLQNKDIIQRGFWAPLEYEKWSFKNGDILEVNHNGAEYTEESIKRYIYKNNINNLITSRVIKLSETKKSILVFMDSVSNCNILCKYLNEKKGIPSVVVDAKMPIKARKDAVDGFKYGKYKVALCFATLGVGFDYPSLDCIVMGRPTFSVRTWYQYCGRLVRIDSGNPNKIGLVVDCCGNYERFGRIEDLTFEDYNNYGWGMFSNDRLLSGIPMGQYMTKKMLDEQYGTDPSMKYGRSNKAKEVATNELDEYKITSGVYKGVELKNVPQTYLEFIINSMDPKVLDKNILNYYTKKYK